MSPDGLILLVDDSRVNRLVLAKLLDSLGLACIEAENGRQAVELLRTRGAGVDIVLLDIVMPEMDGYETLAAIKADEELRHLPVIMISGVDELDSVVRCIEMGATDYLTKPFDPAILGARIRSSLASKRFRDLELEYVERQSATNDLLRVIIGSGFDLQAVLDAVTETAGRLCRADFAGIYLAEDDTYRLAAHAGEDAQLIAEERATPIGPSGASAVGRVALTGAPVSIDDITADAGYRITEWQRVGGYRSLLAVPLKRDGRIVGAIAAARREVRPFTASEVLLVTALADQAVIGIHNVRLLETVERQRTELSRFLSPQVAALVSTHEGQQLLAGHRRQTTAVFCDLRGFTAFSETAEPEEVLGVLRDYHRAMGELIVEHGGTLEHFAGDGMMIFFNDPVPQADHQAAAVRMAVAMRQGFARLATGWRKQGHELDFGVGIATGYATIGRIGFEGRYDYGMIGMVVILASRLSSEARPGQILVSQRTYAAVEDLVVAEPVGELTLKGFSRPVPAMNVLEMRTAEAVAAS